MPKRPVPFTLAGVSRRFRGLPSNLKSFGSFNFGCTGTGNLAASEVKAPYDSLLPLGAITWLFSVRSVAASSFHCAAAAATSISRAAAPALRSGSQNPRIVALPPVACMPNIGFA